MRFVAALAFASISFGSQAFAGIDNPLLVNLGTTANGFGNPTFATSWTQSIGYTGVSIVAYLSTSLSSGGGTAYLTTSIGAGTTSAAEVTSPFEFGVTGSTPHSVALFNNLTLAAGTYYLVLAGPAVGSSSFSWAGDGDATDAFTGPGVTAGSNYTTTGGPVAYGPARSFNASNIGLEVLVAGTPVSVSVPEPSALVVLGSALAGLMFARRRRI